jgi:hypothetical protein
MVEAQFAGITNNSEYHGFTGFALPIGHRLPAVVIQIAEALQRPNHGNTGFAFMLMDLSPGNARR